jgi:hypothetical protein
MIKRDDIKVIPFLIDRSIVLRGVGAGCGALVQTVLAA